MLENSSQDVAIARRYRTSRLGNARMSGPGDEYLSIKVIGINTDGTNAVTRLVNNNLEGNIEFMSVSNSAAPTDDFELSFDGTALVVVVASTQNANDVMLAGIVVHDARAAGALTIVAALPELIFVQSEWDIVQSLVENADATVPLQHISTADYLSGDSMRYLSAIVSGFAGAFGPDAPVCADFEDIRTALGRCGAVRPGMGVRSGHDRATKAARHAMMEIGMVSMYRAASVAVFISGNRSMRLREFAAVMRAVRSSCSSTTYLTLGVSYDEALAESLNVLLIAADAAN